MTTCGRPWGMDVTGGTCKGCWAAILGHLTGKPTEPILPRPEFCQDAALIAWTLDRRQIRREAYEAYAQQNADVHRENMRLHDENVELRKQLTGGQDHERGLPAGEQP